MQMGMLPPHQTLPSCYYHPKPEYCTHRTRVPQSLELFPAQGHEVRSYQHARCLGAWQELQQGWEQVQREQSKAEEGIIRWNGQRMSVLIKLPQCRRARQCTLTRPTQPTADLSSDTHGVRGQTAPTHSTLLTSKPILQTESIKQHTQREEPG